MAHEQDRHEHHDHEQHGLKEDGHYQVDQQHDGQVKIIEQVIVHFLVMIMNVRGGLKVGVECDTMETHRLLFLAAKEESLGDRSNTSLLLKGQATHPVGFF